MERDSKFIKRISLSNNKLDKFLKRERRKKIYIYKKKKFESSIIVSSSKFYFLNQYSPFPKYTNSSFEVKNS